MRKLSLLCAAVAVNLWLWSYSANAITTTLQFTAQNFTAQLVGPGPVNQSAPTDPVVATIVFDKSEVDFSINSLISIDLTIDGHAYSLAETLAPYTQ